MAAAVATKPTVSSDRKPIEWSNLALGAALQLFEVSTLTQPFEVLKTHLAANRGDSLGTAISKTYARGGIKGFYQGLIPWAWFEASTKGSVLVFTQSEVNHICKQYGISPATSGIISGIAGGVAQAYLTMGLSTFMKTVEITRTKTTGPQKSSIEIAKEIYQREGIRGLNKGVNAVALRQATNWGSRFGIARIVEGSLKKIRAPENRDKPLTMMDKVIASGLAGALSCWNQPIEVVRVEMQSQIKTPGRPEPLTMWKCLKWIYQNNGLKGLYRGVVPRIGLGIWQSIVMIAGGDYAKQLLGKRG